MQPCDTHWAQVLATLTPAGAGVTDQASMGPLMDAWQAGADLAQDAGDYCPRKLVWFLGVRKTMTRNPDGLCPYCVILENADAWIAKAATSAAATTEELGLA